MIFNEHYTHVGKVTKHVRIDNINTKEFCLIVQFLVISYCTQDSAGGQ